MTLRNRFEDEAPFKARRKPRREDIRGHYYRDTTAIYHRHHPLIALQEAQA